MGRDFLLLREGSNRRDSITSAESTQKKEFLLAGAKAPERNYSSDKKILTEGRLAAPFLMGGISFCCARVVIDALKCTTKVLRCLNRIINIAIALLMIQILAELLKFLKCFGCICTHSYTVLRKRQSKVRKLK